MNENTLKERISEVEEQLNNTFNGEEQAVLSEKLKDLRNQLRTLKYNTNKKEPKLKTNIDAPIIGDREEVSGIVSAPNLPGEKEIFHIGI